MGIYSTLVITCSSLLLTACALRCYSCTNNPGGDDKNRPYDPACGDRNYSGNHTTHTAYDRCCTMIWANGYISRTDFAPHIEDGDCYHIDNSAGERVDCICTTGDLCNTGTYCEQCNFPFSTHHTATATTITTTTSEVTTTSTTESLSCYSCYDCPEVDANTQVIQDSNIASCVTTLLLDSGAVIRGESNEDMPDGYCRYHVDGFESLSCWCTSSLCNDQALPQLLDHQ